MKKQMIMITMGLIAGSLFNGCSCERAKKPHVEESAARAVAAARTGKGVIELGTSAEFEQLLKSNEFVIIDFYAPWCNPCKQFAPTFEKLAQEFSNITFVKINTEAHPEISQKYNIQSIPTLVLIKNGQELHRPNKGNLRDELSRLKN